MKGKALLTLMSVLVLAVANYSTLANAPKLVWSCQPKIPERLLKS